jgi:hypothetical protein
MAIVMHPKPLHAVHGFAVFNKRVAPHLIEVRC